MSRADESATVESAISPSVPPATLTWACRAIAVVALAVSIASILQSAWIADDSLIALRPVLNFAHGFGLGFNVGERVQVATSPLWVFVVFVAYEIGGLFYGLLLLSLGLSFTALAILTRHTLRAARSITTLPLLALLLCFSRAYTDFSTSGLENPLGFALVAGMFVAAKRALDDATGRRWFTAACTLGALLFLTRSDYALLAAPFLLVLGVRAARAKEWRRLFTGYGTAAVLVLASLSFSLIYYGSIYPNTYYAKLTTAIPFPTRLDYSPLYFAALYKFDSLTGATIVGAIVLAASRARRAPLALASLGAIVAYLVYIYAMGGDFMAGRFFAVIFLLSLFVIAEFADLRSRRQQIVAACLLVACIFSWPKQSLVATRLKPFPPGVDVNHAVMTMRIVDEKKFYLSGGQGLFAAERPRFIAFLENAENKWKRARDTHMTTTSRVGYTDCGGLGWLSLDNGPETYMFDQCGLADPLLSKLPMYLPHSHATLRAWGPGHYVRSEPPGYVESFSEFKTVREGTFGFTPERPFENRIEDPDVAYVFDQIRLITRGPLFDGARWSAIRALATGQLVARARNAKLWQD